MPYVPDQGMPSEAQSPAASPQVSPNMLLMAAAQMHKMGRLSGQAGPAGSTQTTSAKPVAKPGKIISIRPRAQR
jgi:hypothetical protein